MLEYAFVHQSIVFHSSIFGYDITLTSLCWHGGKTQITQRERERNALIHIDRKRERERDTGISKHTPKATLPHELHPNEDKFSTFALMLLDKLPNKIYMYTYCVRSLPYSLGEGPLHKST